MIGAGLAGSAALLVGCSDDGDPPAKTASPSPSDSPTSGGPTDPAAIEIPDFDPEDWASVRAQFPLDPAMSQFAAFVLSPHTAQVNAAIDGYRQRLGTDTEQALLDGFRLENKVRAAAATFAGGSPGDYALTDSTTMGHGIIYNGLSLDPGDEVLSTTHDFFSTEDALRLMSLRTGAKVERVTLYDEPARASVDEMTQRLVDGVTSRTRVVAVTWVHSSTGVRLPIREIADALPDGVLLCVDGVHGFAAVDVDLPDLGCDFLTSGTHKWLFGPRGTGIVWGRDWAPLTEIIPTFSGPRGGSRLSPGGYHDFEHRWALEEGFRFQQRIGRGRVVERTVAQASQLKEGLAGVDGVEVVTPADPEVSAGVVCVDVPSMLPANAVLELRNRGIVASATPYQTSYLRLGPSIVTTPEEVDAAVAALAEMT